MFSYIMAPARRAGAGWGPNLGAPAARRFTSSGLAIANVLGSQGTVVHLNGDGLDPAHGLVAVAAAKFQVSGGNFQVGRNFKFEIINSCLSLAHIQSFSPSWPLGSCRLAALCPGLGH